MIASSSKIVSNTSDGFGYVLDDMCITSTMNSLHEVACDDTRL